MGNPMIGLKIRPFGASIGWPAHLPSANSGDDEDEGEGDDGERHDEAHFQYVLRHGGLVGRVDGGPRLGTERVSHAGSIRLSNERRKGGKKILIATSFSALVECAAQRVLPSSSPAAHAPRPTTGSNNSRARAEALRQNMLRSVHSVFTRNATGMWLALIQFDAG